MLSEKQINEIREHLDKAQNPLFLYDNDADGLCSFVILRRFIDRGKGIAVRSHPDIEVGYATRVEQLKADYLFVLDRPFLGEKFVEEIAKLGIPIVWIDHHDVDVEYDYENLHYYNSLKSKGGEPVTCICYEVTKRDMWIAMMGCVSDNFMPSFSTDFSEKWPDFWGDVREPFDVYYKTEIGRLAMAIGFGLKDSITNVIAMQNFLIKCKSPAELVDELAGESNFAKKYNEMRKKYLALIGKAKLIDGKKMIFFQYSGETSMSSEIANELSYFNKKKVIVVVYVKDAFCNVSMRGKGVKKILDRVLPRLEGATGGGHEDAVGARVLFSDLDKFKSELEMELK